MKYYDRNNDDNISAIFDFAVNGLDKLTHTYSENENDIVCHSIKLYKDIEKNINNTLSLFLNHWYNDNPTKQF